MSRLTIARKEYLNVRRVILIAICIVFFVSLAVGVSGNSQDQRQALELTPAQKDKLPTIISTSIAIRRVAGILSAQGIRIEAGQLFSRNGRKKLRPQLSAFPEMRLSKVQSEPLRGVIMADRLTLAEKLEIEADTVIVANHIIFSGRAPLFKGPYDFHLFPLESFKSENGRETVITIDTSATVHGVDGVNGVNGTHGKTGANGSNGARGSCSTAATRKGGNGEPGLDGTPGGNGTAGTNGTSGKDGGHQTVPMSNIDVGVFFSITTGGHGGNGGHGAHGGMGGSGGSGGHGGHGADCTCDAGGNGDGGNGGAAGAGGAGGSGGNGGDGGNGGNAGNVVNYRPFDYQTTTMSYKTSGGGYGHGGQGGFGGYAGWAGSPGDAGQGANRLGCERGRDGNRGLTASGGAKGIPGKRGTPGRRGSDSRLISDSWDITGKPGRGVKDPAGFEPGASNENCTEWFWVTFRCDGAQCYETGRTLLGCF